MGLVKDRGQADKVSISHRAYGDKYLGILSKGLENSGVNFYEFGGNRITEKGAIDIIDNLKKDIKLLNFKK